MKRLLKKYLPAKLIKLLVVIRRFMNPREVMWVIHAGLRPQTPIVCRLGNDLRVRVYPFDVIGRSIYVSGFFEANECRAVQKILRPGMTFFDVGANLGQYTLLAADKVGDTGHVHSFEPNGRMYREMEFNVLLNHVDRYCTLNKTALSSSQGEAKMLVYTPGNEVYGSLGSSGLKASTIVGEELVPTCTLDGYIDDHNIAAVDFIKIDVEGAELLVLEGAKRTMQEFHPDMLIEISDPNTLNFGYKAKEVVKLLTENAYVLNSVTREGDLVPIEIAEAEFINGTFLAVSSFSRMQR